MSALTRKLGAATLHVKRDDLTGLAVGGNKTRKLQFVVGAALEEGADTLITTGGIQSNHARQTAAFAVKTGLRCELVLQHALVDPTVEYLRSGNVLLDRLLGAVVHMPARLGTPSAHRKYSRSLRPSACTWTGSCWPAAAPGRRRD